VRNARWFQGASGLLFFRGPRSAIAAFTRAAIGAGRIS